MYVVLAYTNENPMHVFEECRVWQGTSFVRAVREFRKAKKAPLGIYVTLRWG